MNEVDGKPFEIFATIGKSGHSVTAKAEAIAAHGDHDDHWAALSAAGYELKTAARRMEQLYDKLGGHA